MVLGKFGPYPTLGLVTEKLKSKLKIDGGGYFGTHRVLESMGCK